VIDHLLRPGADTAITDPWACSFVMDNESASEQRRLLAAVAAALLGSQGSPVWSRTAELLLLSSNEAQRHHKRATAELSRILGDELTGR
jgi:hypothetical protein